MSEEKPTENELIKEGIAATTRQAIKIGKQAQEIRRLQDRIKELEEKLNKCEWRSIALVEQDGDKYPKDQKFDLWIKDFDKYPSLGPYSYILSNLTWCHEEGRWFTSSGECLTDRVYIHATHARAACTPSTPQEEYHLSKTEQDICRNSLRNSVEVKNDAAQEGE